MNRGDVAKAKDPVHDSGLNVSYHREDYGVVIGECVNYELTRRRE